MSGDELNPFWSNQKSTNPKKSQRLRDSARGQQCLVRLPGCSYNPETVVLAHLNGGGMGAKKSDFQGAFACHQCHLILDGGKTELSKDAIELAHRQGVERTQQYWLENGFIGVLK